MKCGFESPQVHTDTALDSLSPPKRGEGWGEGILAANTGSSSPRPSPPSGEEREKTGAVCGCDQVQPGRFRAVLLVFLAVLGMNLSALAAEDFTASFDAANKLYEQGKFSDAASAYDKLIQSGSVSPALYFNLGNAHFKASHIGQAIAAYRRAEQLAPRDPDVRANLQFARNQIQGPTLAPGRWQRWVGTLTVNEWTLLSVLALWLCLLALAAMQLRPTLKAALRNFALGSGLVTIALGICLAAVWANAASQTVIVTTHDAAIRTGPLDEAKPAFTAHDGAELAVLDAKDDWLQVSAGQHNGWLKREQGIRFPARQTN